MKFFPFVKSLLYTLPPEKAHDLTILALQKNLVPVHAIKEYPSLHTSLWGLSFSNPVGLAAGFDKNAQVIDAVAKHGFGFIETGTVTPLAQTGNEKPRVFRLPNDSAVINRLGFNNKGADVYCRNLHTRKTLRVVGANIGKNKTSEDAISDYTSLLRRVYSLADYITVNISSPNTEGLRALQERKQLEALISALHTTRSELQSQTKMFKPIVIKIAPDNSPAQLEDIAALALEYKLDGLIISNTTISRPDSLTESHKHEQGGLSGKPLFALSTQTLRTMYTLTKGSIPLIGVGGISSGDDAYTKIKAGASLVQLYTGLIYNGFEIVQTIKDDLARLLQKDGFTSIREAVGVQ